MTTKPLLAEVKPEIDFIFDLVKKVRAGKIRIPQFQRAFIWRRDQMIEFLDSISKQYPIGSVLMWETDDEELSSTSWVGPIQIPERPTGMASFLLDGQQRISTLVGTLVADRAENPKDDDPDRWLIRYNAKTHEFEHYDGKTLEPWHFPMHNLMETVPFLSECQRMLNTGGSDGEKYVEDVQNLSQTFTSYKVPTIHISNTDLNHAVQVFSRLNTTGQRMAPDQIVSTLTYAEKSEKSDEFRLADKIDDIGQTISSYGFSGVSRTTILRSLFATVDQNVYETDWGRFSETRQKRISKDLPDAVEPTRDALAATCEFLHSIGVHNHRLLPYSMQIVVLCGFFSQCPSPSDAQKRFLEQWFWVTSFTTSFGATNKSRDIGLVKEFRNVVSNAPFPQQLESMRLDEPAVPLPTPFDMRSARSRAMLSVLLRAKPQDSKGEVLRDSSDQILNEGPNAMGYIIALVTDKELKGSPANRMLRPKEVRKQGQIKNWLLDLASDKREQILLSHAIPVNAYDDLVQDHVESFLQKRLNYIIDLETAFMKEKGVTPPEDRSPRAAAIDTDD